jgi:NADPH-dependent ferric siderophore reductase
MASAKGLVLDTLGRVFTRTARVSAVRDLGHGLRIITVAGPSLRDVHWTRGDKIQIVLPSRDVRTFTPSRWDKGELDLIAFAHGDAPGSLWSRRAAIGDELRFVGPQRSLKRSSRHTVLFGDETSIGLAVAFAHAPLTTILEVGTIARAPVVAGLGVPSTCIERVAGDAHVGDLASAIATALRANPSSELVMSGRAQSIQLVRTRLRTLGITERPANKAYWSVGKVGLD